MEFLGWKNILRSKQSVACRIEMTERDYSRLRRAELPSSRAFSSCFPAASLARFADHRRKSCCCDEAAHHRIEVGVRVADARPADVARPAKTTALRINVCWVGETRTRCRLQAA